MWVLWSTKNLSTETVLREVREGRSSNAAALVVGIGERGEATQRLRQHVFGGHANKERGKAWFHITATCSTGRAWFHITAVSSEAGVTVQWFHMTPTARATIATSNRMTSNLTVFLPIPLTLHSSLLAFRLLSESQRAPVV